MKREMNYLEEFLFSAQTKIDSLNVTTEPENIDEYKYLIIDFEQNSYKIPYDLVFNFCNMYQKLNRDEFEEVEVLVNPYQKLGSIKEKNLVVESNIIQNEDEVSELLEKIVSKVYEKYNFLILPADDSDVEEIHVEDYVLSSFESHSEQNKSQGQNLYSIGFKIKATANKNTEYFPFKVYFRIFEKKNSNNEGTGEIGVDIAEEFNGLAKANKINVLTSRKFTQREKASLRKKFENHEFEDDKERITKNIDAIITQILAHIDSYVSNFDEAPLWFRDSELGKFIQNATLLDEDPKIDATASFRYITQTPLPYSYVDVYFRNNFGRNVYQIKKGSNGNNQINDSLNVCPMCGEAINEKNKIVASNEYVDKFLGCQKCMTIKCAECGSLWSSKKEPKPINRKVNGKYYYMAGPCKSTNVFIDDNLGKNLCSYHAKRCFNSACGDAVYSESMIEKCSNLDCDKSYCMEHINDLHKCETSVCRDSVSPNKYCTSCMERFLNTCAFCNKTMCQSCSRPVLVQNALGSFEFSLDEYICLDCLNLLTNGDNLEVNRRNEAIIREDGNFYPKKKAYLEPYGDLENQYISKDIAILAYKKTKPKDWMENPDSGKLYYWEDEVLKCDNCKQYFRFTKTLKFDKKKHYCDDCLVKCSMCSEEAVIKDCIEYEGKYYCKNCYNKEWTISDLNLDKSLYQEDKKKIMEKVFANTNLSKEYKVVPIALKDVFTCPESLLKVDYSQTKKCDSCGETYAIVNFTGGSKVCKICENLNNFDYNSNKELLINAFYKKSFGDKKDFKAYCTKNTLVVSFTKNNVNKVQLYHFNKKKGKYVLKDNASLDLKQKEVTSDAE